MWLFGYITWREAQTATTRGTQLEKAKTHLSIAQKAKTKGTSNSRECLSATRWLKNSLAASMFMKPFLFILRTIFFKFASSRIHGQNLKAFWVEFGIWRVLNKEKELVFMFPTTIDLFNKLHRSTVGLRYLYFLLHKWTKKETVNNFWERKKLKKSVGRSFE